LGYSSLAPARSIETMLDDVGQTAGEVSLFSRREPLYQPA
jgi:hypothetical protein